MASWQHRALPAPSSPPALRRHRSGATRNFALDLSSAVGLGAIMAVVSVLLPSMARRDGLEPMGLAALAALPFLATFLTMLAGRIGPRTPKRLAVLRVAGAVGLLAVLVAPHPLLIGVATFGFWLSFALGSPLQQRIWATVYDAADRGRLLGYVGTFRFAAGTLALMAITFVAADTGWAPVVVAVVALGVLSAVAVSRMAVPGVELDGGFSAMGSVRAVASNPMLRRITTAQLLFGGGLVAAPAFMAMVHVDRLGLGLDQIAMAGLSSYAATTMTIGLWGRHADHVGALWTVALGALLGVGGIAAYAVAPTFEIVIVGSLLLGTCGAAIDAAWPLLIADHAPDEEQAAVAAGMNTIMGLRGLVTPFLLMAPVHLGLIGETGGLLVCLAACTGGAVMHARTSGLWAAIRVALGAVVSALWAGGCVLLGLVRRAGSLSRRQPGAAGRSRRSRAGRSSAEAG